MISATAGRRGTIDHLWEVSKQQLLTSRGSPLSGEDHPTDLGPSTGVQLGSVGINDRAHNTREGARFWPTDRAHMCRDALPVVDAYLDCRNAGRRYVEVSTRFFSSQSYREAGSTLIPNISAAESRSA